MLIVLRIVLLSALAPSKHVIKRCGYLSAIPIQQFWYFFSNWLLLLTFARSLMFNYVNKDKTIYLQM